MKLACILPYSAGWTLKALEANGDSHGVHAVVQVHEHVTLVIHHARHVLAVHVDRLGRLQL